MLNPEPLIGGGSLPLGKWRFDGFNLGENTYSLSTEIKGSELAAMNNMELYGKRSVRPRRGGAKLGGSLGGLAVDGIFQYKEGAVNQIMGISGGVAKKYNPNNDVWETMSGETFTANIRVRGVKMRGNIYFGDGIDPFARYDGSAIGFFTAVAAPTDLAVVPQGTPGITEYVYTVNTVTDKGDSLTATEVVITNGNEVLSDTNFNRVTFTRRTESQVVGYNVFGRSRRGNGVTLMKFIQQPASGASVTFDDDGTLTPTIWLQPDGDSTDGVAASFWEQLRGSLVGAGVVAQPHRVFYTGTGDKYESFSPSHNGGWVDVRPGDNDNGVSGFAPFQQSIIVAKENSIHQFQYSTTTGDAILTELLTYVGCGAPGSMVVMENDVAFIDSERKMRILGYEPNYTAAIRTTSLSEGRTQSRFDEIDPSKIGNCEAVYHKGRYILAATTIGNTSNNMVLAYDRKYLAFLGKWTGANANVRCWLVYDGIDGRKRLYAGSSNTPYIFEFDLEGTLTDHDGSAVVASIKTRNEDLDNSGQQKIWKFADMRIFRITGTLKLKTITNGNTIIDEKSFTVLTHTGWGVVKWGTVLWGVSTGIGASASDLDKTYRKEIYEQGNSLQFEVSKTGAQDDFILVSMRGEAFLLPSEVFDSDNII